jgi:hypothetical protein
MNTVGQWHGQQHGVSRNTATPSRSVADECLSWLGAGPRWCASMRPSL